VLTSTEAQSTPDANNKVRYVDRRRRMVAGQLTTWGSGNDPWREADLNWNGRAWASCPANFGSKSSVRDSLGANICSQCGQRERGRSVRFSSMPAASDGRGLRPDPRGGLQNRPASSTPATGCFIGGRP
jgi:hypothetical protein